MSENENTSLIPVDDCISELFDSYETKPKRKISYIPSFFTTASLPFKNVHKPVFTRKGTMGITLTLTSPKNVPYGRYGRLLLSIFTTHAVISNTDDVIIKYNSLSDLLKELQLPKQRGAEIMEQLKCFSNCSFSFEQKKRELQSGYLFSEIYNKDRPEKDVIVKTVSTGNIRFITAMQFKEVTELGKDNKLGYFQIVLSDEFIAFCKKHSVPIDYNIYKEILSPLGKDLYAWLVYRNNVITSPVFIPRAKLVEQFMPVEDSKNSNQVNVNYAKIVERLKEIKEKYYKDLNITFNSSGIVLQKSNNIIKENDKRYTLVSMDL